MKVKITTKENMNFYSCPKNAKIDIDLEDYIACVVASEIGNAPLEACKAQAIAARTFAVSRGVLNGKPISDSASVAQAFRATRNNYTNCNQAAKDTMAEILTFNDKPISAVYSDCNGGRTYSSEEVWGSSKQYLVVQKDVWDDSSKRSGHGVGMSQRGAINAAKQGKSYKEILSFYYPGAKIKPYRSAVFSRLRSIVNRILERIK